MLHGTGLPGLDTTLEVKQLEVGLVLSGVKSEFEAELMAT